MKKLFLFLLAIVRAIFGFRKPKAVVAKKQPRKFFVRIGTGHVLISFRKKDSFLPSFEEGILGVDTPKVMGHNRAHKIAAMLQKQTGHKTRVVEQRSNLITPH